MLIWDFILSFLFLSEERFQITKIEAALETDMEKKAWSLGYGMGWRLSEMQRLLLEDITETDITVHGKIRIEDQGLLPEIREVLLAGTEGLGPNDHIFGGQRGPMSNNGIWRMVGGFLARASVAGSTHTLRHGYGTALALKGCDAHTIMRLMRHKTLKEAIRYIHMAESHLAERQRKYCPLGIVKDSQGKAPFVNR